jgi:hypothetical protein
MKYSSHLRTQNINMAKQDLKNKLEIVANEHAEGVWQEGVENMQWEMKESFLITLGQVNLANKLVTSLQAQMIRELQDFRDNKKFEAFGFTRFDDFLDKYKFAPLGYDKFNRLEKLLKNEGDVLFDLYNTLGLPQTTRKLLAEKNGSEIIIDGNELIIGDNRADLSNLPDVKQLISEFVTDNNKLTAEKAKVQAKLEKAESVISQGHQDYKALQRTIDSQNQGAAYDRSLSRLISSFIAFNDQVDLLPLVEKDKNSALKTIWLLLEESRSRFGSNINFLDTTATAKVSDKAKKVFADDDDFGDEN